MKARITIDGKDTTIRYQGTDYTYTNAYSRQLAASIYLDQHSPSGYTGYWNDEKWRSAGQLLVWRYWDTWRKQFTTQNNFNPKDILNTTSYDNYSKLTTYQEIMKDTLGEYNYTATIYYLVSNDSDQQVILTEANRTEKNRDIPVEKKWVGGTGNAITAQLILVDQSGNETIWNERKLGESNNWESIWKDVPKEDKNGNKYRYKVREKNVPNGYTVEYSGNANDGFTITNIKKNEPVLINVKIQKKWIDDSNRDKLRPTEIKLTLYADGKKAKDADNKDVSKIVLNEDNDWTATISNLYKYTTPNDTSSTKVKYTVTEDEFNNDNKDKYKDVEISVGTETKNTLPITVTNTHRPEKIVVGVTKVWNDNNDKDKLRPEKIGVVLLANNKAIDEAILGEENNWEYFFTDLYKYGTDQKEIEYTIEEREAKEVEIEVEDEETGKTKIETIWEVGDSKTIDGYVSKITKETVNGGKSARFMVLDSVDYTITNTHYDGYIEIKGKVWNDGAAGKGNAINGTFDSSEQGVKGVKAILKDKDGNQFDATSYAETAEDGTYTIKVNYDNSSNVYKLYEDADKVKAKLKTAKVEFEYDGMTYTTVKTAGTGENTSKAKENEETRNKFDNEHSTVVSGTKHPDEWTDKKMTATTEEVISFETYSDIVETKKQETLKYCNNDGTYTYTNLENAWSEPQTGKHNAHTEKCPIMKQYDIDVEVIQNVNLGLFEREQPDVAIYSDIKKVEVTMNDQHYTYVYDEISKNVDKSDANWMRVKYQEKNNLYSDPAVYNYKREINPADIAYINQIDGTAMSVQVTYKIVIGNLSATLPITVDNIANYYDSRYELITEGWNIDKDDDNKKGFNVATNAQDLNIRVEPGHESEAIQLTYNINVEAIKGLLNQDATLQNAVEILSYSTEYGEKTLYAEQRSGGRTGNAYAGYDYNSHPGNAGIYADETTYTDSDGKEYKKVKILKEEVHEDDSFVAPSFILCKAKEQRALSGNVWEDTDADNTDEYRIGNGKKDDNEQNLANAKVELFKVNDDGTGEQAKLYNKEGASIPAVAYSDEKGNYSFGDENYGVVTDRYFMKFTYGEGIDGSTTSTINNFNVNARNYKSTIISEGPDIKDENGNTIGHENETLYNIFKGTTTSDEQWHLKTPKGYSVAVDDIEKRVLIEDLKYDNFGNTIFMEAYSKVFAMQVEFDPSTEKTSQVGKDGNTGFGNDLSVFDFGVIERAREDIYTEKTIENIKVTLENGQILTQGNPNNSGELSYAKAIGFNRFKNSEDSRTEHYKRLTIEMDQELIQGAQLDITYSLKVINDSEKEYDYYLGDTAEVCANPTKYDPTKVRTEFYYFGTYSSSDKLINSSINCLVDYVDADLEYKWENADKWQEKTASELLGEGYISQKTHDAIANDYKAYITEQYAELAPGESSELEYAYASRILANTEDNYSNTFENHMEILKIDAKTARTIKETGKIKLYKMGNYVPSIGERKINDDISNESAGVHEQDDDKVEVIVTPPTGAINNIITYTIVGLAGLLIISVGIIIIKKKVLTK